MGLIPRETQGNINSALKVLYSIDKSLDKIATALEEQNELLRVDAVIRTDGGEDDECDALR